MALPTPILLALQFTCSIATESASAVIGMPQAANPNKLEPHAGNIDRCSTHRVLYISGFRDIKRGSWKVRPRSVVPYVQSFRLWVTSLSAPRYRPNSQAAPIVVYTDEHLGDLPSAVTVIPLSHVNDSIYDRFLAAERDLINSAKFRSRIPHGLQNKIEYTRAEYNMATHEKQSWIRDAARRFPSYTHYAWVDFAAIRKSIPEYAPDSINPCRLPGDRILASAADTWYNPWRPVFEYESEGVFWNNSHWSSLTDSYAGSFPKDAICGTVVFYPRALVPSFQNQYEQALSTWHKLGWAGHDQAMLMMLFKKGLPFSLWTPPTSEKGGLLRCRAIFRHYLNIW